MAGVRTYRAQAVLWAQGVVDTGLYGSAVEQPPCKWKVGGSNPPVGSTNLLRSYYLLPTKCCPIRNPALLKRHNGCHLLAPVAARFTLCHTYLLQRINIGREASS